jgi:hemoglobin-like flavoprotein
MNSAEINLVQATFDAIRPHTLVTAEIFYRCLFVLDPSRRPLFHGDMLHQSRMPMAMLGAAVNGLANLEALVLVVRQFGPRHVNYVMEEEHYVAVGSALLWALDEGLGEKFTPAGRYAWTSVNSLFPSARANSANKRSQCRSAATWL